MCRVPAAAATGCAPVLGSGRVVPGATALQALHLAAVAFGRAARTPVANRHLDHRFPRRRGRTVVDETLRGHRRADPLLHDARHHDDPVPAAVPEPYLVPHMQGLRGLGPVAVDPDVSGAAGGSGLRAGLGQPYRPDPTVDADASSACGVSPETMHPTLDAVQRSRNARGVQVHSAVITGLRCGQSSRTDRPLPFGFSKICF